jgi:hypothetical protein
VAGGESGLLYIFPLVICFDLWLYQFGGIRDSIAGMDKWTEEIRKWMEMSNAGAENEDRNDRERKMRWPTHLILL